MADGTMWIFDKKDTQGNMIYKYQKDSSPIKQDTQYQRAKISPDYSNMILYYTFSMKRIACPMIAIYRYFGEGKEPAINYITEE